MIRQEADEEEDYNSVLVTQSCPTLCDPMNCSPAGFSVHRILKERILERVAIPFCRESSRPRDSMQDYNGRRQREGSRDQVMEPASNHNRDLCPKPPKGRWGSLYSTMLPTCKVPGKKIIIIISGGLA